MTESSTPDPQRTLSNDEIAQQDLPGWARLAGGLSARFETGDFQTGLELVSAFGAAAEEAGHHPDLVLTYPALEVKLVSHDVGGITSRDVLLAQAFNGLAKVHGVSAQPAALSEVELALDTPDFEKIAPFWAAVLGYRQDGDELVDPSGRGPTMWFQKRASDETAASQRFHLDIWVSPDVAQDRISGATAAGGVVVDDSQAPSFVVLADADGNKACICTSLDRAGT